MYSSKLLAECICLTYPPDVESSSGIWGSSVLMVIEDGIGKSIHCP
jgi:hypothetical protein